MPQEPLQVVQEFLAGAFNPDELDDAVKRLVADDATYVSLNYSDPELHRIMPWAGTKHGAAAFIENFQGVRRRWFNDSFDITDTVVDGNKVVVLGRFTLRSVTLDQTADSPFVVFARVENGRISYFQYMEDTFATARSFRESGTWTIRADPDALDPIEV